MLFLLNRSNMEDLNLLEEVGLTKSEAKIYMTLIRYGPLTAGRIVTLSKQHISVTYAALQRLAEKGYVSHIRKGKFEEYSVMDPEVFLDKLKETIQSLEPRISAWRKYTESAKDRTTVEVFEGIKGLTNMVNQTLKTAKKGDYWRSFTLGEENKLPDVLPFFKKVNEKRIRLGLKTRLVCNKAYKDAMYSFGDSHHLSTSNLRFVDFEFPQGVIIFQDNIIFFSWMREPKAIHIKDKKISEQYAKFFDKLYATGEPYKPPK